MKQNLDGSESGIKEIPIVLSEIECEDILKRKKYNKNYLIKYRKTHKKYFQQYFKNYANIHKNKLKKYHADYRIKNKEHLQKRNKNYYLKNKGQIRLKNLKNKSVRNEYNKSYYRINKRKLNNYRCKYLGQRYKDNTLFKIKHLLRTRLGDICKQKRIIKSKKTLQILGCSILEFKTYMEKLFEPGMSWVNHGKLGWHIDHKIPLITANNQQELEILCHYKNLQPLWWYDNLSKGGNKL